MTESIIVAIITGGMALLGSVLTSNRNAAATDAKLDKQQAVMATEIKTLTEEVKKHNDFASRVPSLETRVGILENQVNNLHKFHETP